MTLRACFSIFALLLSSNALTGCFIRWSDTPEPVPAPPIYRDDPDAEPTFGFTMSRGCSPFERAQCPPTRPLMAGVRERASFTIHLDGPAADPTVSSSDTAVIAVDPVQRVGASDGSYQGLFEVRAGVAGSATVTIQRADGQAWQYVLRVEEAAGMDLVEDEGTAQFDRADGRLRLRVGDRVSMNGYPVSRDVEALYANDQVTWSVPNTEHVVLSWSFMRGPRVTDDHVYVEGVAPGTDVITVRAGVVERTVIVDVTR